MDKNRVLADLNLIDELLSCPSGEELALLQANEELIDADLVVVMEQVATKLDAEGNQETANFLQTLAVQVRTMLGQEAETTTLDENRSQAYLNLIEQLIHCPNGEEQKILDVNLELVDAGLVQTIVQIATGMAHQGNEETAKFLVHLARELARTLGLYPQVSNSSPMQSEAGLA